MTEGGESEEEGITITMAILVQLIIAALILLAIFAYIQNIYTDESYEKNYLAKDMALIIESLQVPQGNTALQYSKYTDSYTMTFRDGRAEVFSSIEGAEPLSFLRGIAGFSVDKNFIFEETELKYAGIEIHPQLVRQGNEIKINQQVTENNLNLYHIITADTSGERKDYKFYTTEQEPEYKQYVQALPDNINAAAQTNFAYSQTNPDFIISRSDGGNIIYAPADSKKRKLAEMIANSLIKQKADAVILPSQSVSFVIKIDDSQKENLLTALKEAFKEYYNE